MKMQRLDLETLSERTNIECAHLQSILDDGLVPERTWLLQADDENQLSGIDELNSTFLVCANLLLDAGYTESRIPEILRTICLVMKPGRNPLRLPVASDIVAGANRVVVQIAEGEHVCWKVDGRDTGWIRVRAGRRQSIADFSPRVVTAIDMTSIHDQVLGR
ncbi:MAG: hypothetical protein O3C17_14645 [Planctomycetota bacterium]|nr:hypothetical protein [Planctomycetota bacterium]